MRPRQALPRGGEAESVRQKLNRPTAQVTQPYRGLPRWTLLSCGGLADLPTREGVIFAEQLRGVRCRALLHHSLRHEAADHVVQTAEASRVIPNIVCLVSRRD